MVSNQYNANSLSLHKLENQHQIPKMQANPLMLDYPETPTVLSCQIGMILPSCKSAVNYILVLYQQIRAIKIETIHSTQSTWLAEVCQIFQSAHTFTIVNHCFCRILHTLNSISTVDTSACLGVF